MARKSPPVLEGIIFDLDGTLSDTWPPALAAFREAIDGHSKHEFSDEELIALAGPAEEGILQKLFPEDWEACFDQYLHGFTSRLVPGKILYPGILETLQFFTNNQCRMAIVSGKTQLAVEVSCRLSGITEMFDMIIGGSVEGDRKVEGIAQVLDHWGMEPSAAAYIGDSKGDILAAKTTGTYAIAAAWAEVARKEQLLDERPDILFETVDAFNKWAIGVMRR